MKVKVIQGCQWYFNKRGESFEVEDKIYTFNGYKSYKLKDLNLYLYCADVRKFLDLKNKKEVIII